MLIFKLLLLIGGTLSAQRTPADKMGEGTEWTASLDAIDPPELIDFLQNTSNHVTFSSNVFYNNRSYLVNWADTLLLPGNRRFWYTIFSDENMSTDLQLRTNLSTCVYDVTENIQFFRLHRISRSPEFEKNFVFLQCNPGECLEDDFGCGKNPFKWWRIVVPVVSFLILVVLIVIHKNYDFIRKVIITKLKRRNTTPAEEPLHRYII